KGSPVLAKAARVPVCESAGAGPRVGESSLNEGCEETSAVMTRSVAPAPVAARSALDSKAMRLPSPLKVGLRFMVSSGVLVKRRGASLCERATLTSRQTATAKVTATAKTRLAAEAKVALLFSVRRRG